MSLLAFSDLIFSSCRETFYLLFLRCLGCLAPLNGLPLPLRVLLLLDDPTVPHFHVVGSDGKEQVDMVGHKEASPAFEERTLEQMLDEVSRSRRIDSREDIVEENDLGQVDLMSTVFP